jgi:hypothetical protein
MPRRLPSFGRSGVIEMAADRIADGIAQRIEIVGFGEDRMAESTCHEAAFQRLLDRKDELARGPLMSAS